MNTIKQAVSELFGSPMQNMSYVSYFRYVNEAGKITAKSLLELVTICLTYIDEQENKNTQFEENFKEIEKILAKLTDKKLEEITPKEPEENPYLEPLDQSVQDVAIPINLKEFEKATTTNKKSK